MRILIGNVMQPPITDHGEIQLIVNRVPEQAVAPRRAQMQVTFGVGANGAAADHPARS